MNYIILNGKRSSDVNGLLIQSLPSISKPLMRTEIEEIDGRDGDIVTKLGYSAYDKEMEVGLYGNFNIDDVISYFDSEGTVIFSNEPDKFYKYQILEQIDFEKLLRFKTAKVTFHVQPFKYSAVDRVLVFKNQLMQIKDYSETINGITVTAFDGVISVSGTGTESTEFYVPIEDLEIPAGSYTLTAIGNGSRTNRITMRLVKDAPLATNTFGGESLVMQNGVVDISADLEEGKTYNYLWFYITGDVAINSVLNITFADDNNNSFLIKNRGNTVSKPKYVIYGDNVIHLSINNEEVLVINLDDAGYIVIDSAEMNAYQGQMLLNRRVTGDYNNLALSSGYNTISWTGNVTRLEVDNYSRWI